MEDVCGLWAIEVRVRRVPNGLDPGACSDAEIAGVAASAPEVTRRFRVALETA